MSILELLKQNGTVYTAADFVEATIEAVDTRLSEKGGKWFLKCFVRNKEVIAKPEEIVRQLWLHRLLNRYRYEPNRITVEYPVTFGRDTSKRADIVIFDADRPTVPYCIVEVKAPNFKSGKDGRKDGTGIYVKPARGPAPHEGAVYIVAGSSGQKSGGKLDHPVSARSLNVLGSLVLDFDGPRLDATFIDDKAAVRDYFTIVKGAGPR